MGNKGMVCQKIIKYIEKHLINYEPTHLPENTPYQIYIATDLIRMPLRNFVLRIQRYAHTEPEVFFASVIILDRFLVRSGILCSPSVVHKLLMTAVVLVSKFYGDVFYTDIFYEILGGLPLGSLRQMCVNFLFVIDFHLLIDDETIDHYKQLKGCITSLSLILINKKKQTNNDDHDHHRSVSFQ